MLLEYNLYENFNPNTMERDFIKEIEPIKEVKGYPSPYARGTLMDYELFQTGFEYTSSGIATTDIKVGDVMEVLTTNTIGWTGDKLSIWYVVISVEEGNRVTLKNYYWYLIEGTVNSTFAVPSSSSFAFNYMINNSTGGKQVMSWGIYTTDEAAAIQLKYNLKDDTVSSFDLSKSLFSKIQMEPQALSKSWGDILGNRLSMCLTADENVRTRQQTRIDIVQNPTVEVVVTTERSNYNFLRVILKNENDKPVMSTLKEYTINDKGKLVKLDSYTGDGKDLPELRTVKTMFFEAAEPPTDAQLINEVRGDSVVHKIYFDQNRLRPLNVNDLVDVWYNGTKYSGHIADKCYTEAGERLSFVEFGGL